MVKAVRDAAERHFQGTAVSRGVGIGKAVILDGEPVVSERVALASSETEREIERLRQGLAASADELRHLAAGDATGIFDVHLLMLEDAFGSSVEEIVTREFVSAEAAIRRIAHDLAERQRSVADEHIREKYLDIYDVAERLIRSINGDDGGEGDRPGCVYIVSDLTPSKLIELAAHHPKAIVSEQGGWTSHTSILAREFKIPAVSGIRDMHEQVAPGSVVLVNGFTGAVVVEPSPATIETAKGGRQLPQASIRHDLESETETADGVSVIVRVNANQTETYGRAKRAGAFGIGLYRSEILFDRNNDFPSEDEQYTAYREIAKLAGDAGVRIRTFDVGTDRVAGTGRTPTRNPALGLRAVRLSLTEEEHFRPQVRAILRAAKDGRVGLVLPMVAGVNDIARARAIIEDERLSLSRSGIPFGDIELGAMIETPSAVLTAADIAAAVDLICLGTNDLVQYLLAVDRDDPSVADWYQTLHPAVVRAVHEIAQAGADAGIPVSLCGEMAGSPFYVPLLLGLGIRELSMNVNSIASVRAVIADLDMKKCRQLASAVRASRTAAETDEILTSFYRSNWPSILNTVG